MLQTSKDRIFFYQTKNKIIDTCMEMEFLAYDFLKDENLKKAEEIFQTLKNKNPYYLGGHEGLAYVYMKKGENKKSIILMKKAISLAKSQFLNPKINQELIQILEDNLEKLQKFVPFEIPWLPL